MGSKLWSILSIICMVTGGFVLLLLWQEFGDYRAVIETSSPPDTLQLSDIKPDSLLAGERLFYVSESKSVKPVIDRSKAVLDSLLSASPGIIQLDGDHFVFESDRLRKINAQVVLREHRALMAKVLSHNKVSSDMVAKNIREALENRDLMLDRQKESIRHTGEAASDFLNKTAIYLVSLCLLLIAGFLFGILAIAGK